MHWTNESIIDRIRVLKDKCRIVEIYDSSYYYCNLLVHSMYSEVTRDADAVHLFNWNLHELANEMFLAGTRIVNNMVGAIPEEILKSRIQDIEAISIKSFFGELVKAGRTKRAG